MFVPSLYNSSVKTYPRKMFNMKYQLIYLQHYPMSPVAHSFISIYPDSRIPGANIWNTWDLSAPGGPHVGPMNLVIRIYSIGLYTPTLARKGSLWGSICEFKASTTCYCCISVTILHDYKRRSRLLDNAVSITYSEKTYWRGNNWKAVVYIYIYIYIRI